MTDHGLSITGFWRWGRDRLLTLYEKEEAGIIMDWLLEELASVNRAERMSRPQLNIEEDHRERIAEALNILLTGKPVQYILGKVWFYGLEFKVDERVLIPRPETEELVHLIIQDLGPGYDGRILDVGTGSGCIAVTLAKYLIHSRVSALDIDEGALGVATGNAQLHQVSINFFKHDISLGHFRELPVADIIVSNPPYVRESEKPSMRSNVLEHEPYQALFVGDADPLYYYRKIFLLASDKLSPGGRVYMEINESMGEQLVSFLAGGGAERIGLLKDLRGKDRFVRFSLAG